MSELWPILLQFLLRLCFGVALAMAITSARKVTSGFYRVHLWMIMGLATFGALITFSQAQQIPRSQIVLGGTILLAVLSYAGAVVWMYERRGLGVGMLYAIACLALGIALVATHWPTTAGAWLLGLQVLACVAGGLLLGFTLTAMLLGHWYLNTPTMELSPLRKLLRCLAIAIALQAGLSLLGVAWHVGSVETVLPSWWMFLALRWLAGLIGTAVMLVMTWQTLKIPNTQSATGILYAGVILAFIGELTGQLLSVDTLFPV